MKKKSFDRQQRGLGKHAAARPWCPWFNGGGGAIHGGAEWRSADGVSLEDSLDDDFV